MFINFFLDFLLLLGVSILLKRNTDLKRIIMASFVGGISILILFIPLSNLLLFFFKFLISVAMILIAFNYSSIKYTLINILYLYVLSIFLGGFLYFLNDQFCIQRKGFIFINNKFSITLLSIIILSPIIIYLYIRQSRILKNNYNNYYDVVIYYNDNFIKAKGFLDSGNCLSYLSNNVILLDKRKMIFDIKTYLFIPYETISSKDILKGFKPDKVIINGKVIKKVLVGISNINKDGIDILLNNNIKELI